MKMSQSQTKDELINLLKKNYDQMKQENVVLKKQNEEFKKGNAGSEEQTKALTEMHSQKVKTLLKSINNLKKEVQKEKFEKKDNVRIQKIQRLEKDIELQEVAMNALRKLVNSEDKCEAAIAQAFASGPKRVRIASREELKIEINKYKNTLDIMEEFAGVRLHYYDLRKKYLIHKLTLRGAWPVLSTGAVLVNLPGVRDSNAA